MSVKLYWKPILVSQYDIAGMETWLERTAEKGFLLYDLGHIFGKFTKSEPKKVRYRLEPAGEDTEYPSLLMQDLYKQNGWQYIATFRKLFHVFMTEDTAVPEIHTDPLVQSESLKTLDHQRRNTVLFSLVFDLVLLISWGHLFRGRWVSYFVLNFNPSLYLILPLFIWGIFIVFNGPIAKLWRSLRAGRPLEHRRNYKRTVISNGFKVLLVLVLLLLVSLPLIGTTTGISNSRSLSEAPNDMPVLSLKAIDPDYTDNTDGDFYSEYSPLVPEQHVVIQGLNTNDTDMQSVLQTNFYKTVFPGLAEPVYKEMIQTNFKRFNVATSEREMQDYETLDTTLFDEAVYTQFDDKQFLIAYRDKTIIVVRYEGDVDLRDKLALIADTFL